jgi:hypothetical protein
MFTYRLGLLVRHTTPSQDFVLRLADTRDFILSKSLHCNQADSCNQVSVINPNCLLRAIGSSEVQFSDKRKHARRGKLSSDQPRPAIARRKESI